MSPGTTGRAGYTCLGKTCINSAIPKRSWLREWPALPSANCWLSRLTGPWGYSSREPSWSICWRAPEGQGATGIGFRNGRVTVTSAAPGTAAEAAALKPGDVFLAVGGSSVLNGNSDPDRLPNQLSPEEAAAAALTEAPGEPVPIQVLRDGQLVRLSLAPELGALDGLSVAVRPDERRSEPVWRAVPLSFRQTWDVLVIFRNEISRIIARASSIDLVGPVGIARITSEVADAGLSPLIQWTALLSINLAIVNMLPIPALDGGRIMFVLIELARGGRRLAPERERIVNMVGFAILISAIVAISIGDIRRIIGGESVFGQ